MHTEGVIVKTVATLVVGMTAPTVYVSEILLPPVIVAAAHRSVIEIVKVEITVL